LPAGTLFRNSQSSDRKSRNSHKKQNRGKQLGEEQA